MMLIQMLLKTFIITSPILVFKNEIRVEEMNFICDIYTINNTKNNS